MDSPPHILDYSKPVQSFDRTDVRRFQIIYGVGIGFVYAVIAFCASQWPHTSNSADPRKAELAMAIQVAGGAACAWLAVASRRIIRSRAIRFSVWTWLLVAANLLPGLEVLPHSYM